VSIRFGWVVSVAKRDRGPKNYKTLAKKVPSCRAVDGRARSSHHGDAAPDPFPALPLGTRLKLAIVLAEIDCWPDELIAGLWMALDREFVDECREPGHDSGER